MSSSKKKRASSNAMDTSEPTPQSLIDVDFEAVSPTEHHFEGVRNLLERLLHSDTSINRSVLSDIVIRNADVASVVVQCLNNDDDEDEEEDDTVFGLMTVLNVSKKEIERNQSQQTPKQKSLSEFQSTLNALNEYLQNLPFVSKKKNEAVELLNDKSNRIGLIVNERMLGIPVQIAAPLYDSFASDLKKIARIDENFRFTHLLLLSRLLVADENNCFAANAEEDALAQIADLVLDVEGNEQDVQGKEEAKDDKKDDEMEDDDDEDDDEVLAVRRKVLVFSIDKLDQMVDKVKGLMGS